MSFYKHESAIIDEGAEVGAGARIWHFVHVCGGARLGRDVVLGQNVYIGGRVQIGARCKIQNNVSVYDGVTLEDDVFVGPSAVFTNVLNPRAHVERKDEYRPTLVRTGATLGANCTIVCGVTVGRYALVAAGAVVTSDVRDFGLVIGVPARQRGWVSRRGEKLDLPLKGQAEASCPVTRELYRLDGDLLRCLAE